MRFACSLSADAAIEEHGLLLFRSRIPIMWEEADFR
jgi:hypothetical protein